jgi:hypothetical protein
MTAGRAVRAATKRRTRHVLDRPLLLSLTLAVTVTDCTSLTTGGANA